MWTTTEVNSSEAKTLKSKARSAIRGGAVAGGGDRLHTVDPDAGELRAEAAHRDRAAFAGVALDGDAGDALQRLGEVLVGEAGDILGDDRVDRRHRFALQVERRVQRGAKAGDDDIGLGRFGRCGLRLRGRGVGGGLRGGIGGGGLRRGRGIARRLRSAHAAAGAETKASIEAAPNRRERLRLRGRRSRFEVMFSPSKHERMPALPLH